MTLVVHPRGSPADPGVCPMSRCIVMHGNRGGEVSLTGWPDFPRYAGQPTSTATATGVVGCRPPSACMNTVASMETEREDRMTIADHPGPTSRPVPQWTRPGETPVETLGRQGNHH